jgi:hypothetical protein
MPGGGGGGGEVGSGEVGGGGEVMSGKVTGGSGVILGGTGDGSEVGEAGEGGGSEVPGAVVTLGGDSEVAMSPLPRARDSGSEAPGGDLCRFVWGSGRRPRAFVRSPAAGVCQGQIRLEDI